MFSSLSLFVHFFLNKDGNLCFKHHLFLCSPKAPPPPAAPEPEWSEIVSDVVHLTDKTFDDFIAANKKTLVMFYAPCECISVCVCVCVSVCVRVCACAHALRVASRDKILRFKNTFIIIIINYDYIDLKI